MTSGDKRATVVGEVGALTPLLTSCGFVGPDFLNRATWGPAALCMPGVRALPAKVQRTHVSGFAGHKVSVHLGRCSPEAFKDSM